MSNDSKDSQITVFAKTNFRNKEVPFGIKADDRRRHMYLIGKTGMGKTTLMENMVIQDIRHGHGVAFLDPHGDSVQRILDAIPSSRVNDVIYFNPADMSYPVAFNILESVDIKYKHLVASGLMGVFTKIWANLWSARMEYILNNTILALLDSPGNTLLGITRMYVDKRYRKKIVDNIKDPMVRAFWTDEFANYNEKYRTEAIAPIQNKVGQFLSSGIIRNIVGQPKSTIDLREIMDQNKILIMDLSKGKVGEDNSALLGAMIVTKLQLAAMSRTDIPEDERKDFYLYVDEFQNFATESFATILSEARKYRLNLIVGHQYIGQLVQERNTKVRDAIFGNVGTLAVFRVGAEDAEFLVKEFEPLFTETDLLNLPKYNILLKLMINGVASEAFSATTLPPAADQTTGNGEKVIRVSRERYTNPVAEVEDKISRWMGAEYHQEAAVVIGSQPVEALAEVRAEQLASHIGLPLKTLPAQEQPQLKEPVAEPPAEFRFDDEPTEDKQEKNVHEQKTQARPVAEQRPVQNSSSRPERRSNENQGQNRDYRPFGKPGQDRRQQPSRNNRPRQQNPQKRDNPIWDTVANLQQEQTRQNKEKINQTIDTLLRPSTQPEKTAPVPQAAMKSEKPPLPPAQSKRMVLRPGETHSL